MEELMIRLLLVNEFRLMCNVLASVLGDESDIEIVGITTNVEDALAQASKSDVLLVSTRLPNNGALRLTHALNEAEMPVRVLILGLTDTEAEVIKYVEAGAAGYVLQDDSVDELLRNVRAAYQGEALVSPGIAGALMARVSELAQLFATIDGTVADVVDFTPREREILQLLAEDMTNQEIADFLVIEVGTVKNHVHNILDKLGVSSRHEAAAYWALMNHA
jgi:two-component system, NarL family, nitrate/nitrite response regulator NarL